MGYCDSFYERVLLFRSLSSGVWGPTRPYETLSYVPRHARDPGYLAKEKQTNKKDTHTHMERFTISQGTRVQSFRAWFLKYLWEISVEYKLGVYPELACVIVTTDGVSYMYHPNDTQRYTTLHNRVRRYFFIILLLYIRSNCHATILSQYYRAFPQCETWCASPGPTNQTKCQNMHHTTTKRKKSISIPWNFREFTPNVVTTGDSRCITPVPHI